MPPVVHVGGYRISKNGTFRPVSLPPISVSSSAASSSLVESRVLRDLTPFICVFPNDLPA